MGEGRLVPGDLSVEWRQRLTVEGERGPVVQRPTAERQESARSIVGGHHRHRRPPLVLTEARRSGPFDGERAYLLADPAVDRGRSDAVADVPVGAFMLEADRRPHEACTRRECELASAHWAEAQIGLAQTRFSALAALERSDDRRRQRPAQLRLPDEIEVA